MARLKQFPNRVHKPVYIGVDMKAGWVTGAIVEAAVVFDVSEFWVRGRYYDTVSEVTDFREDLSPEYGGVVYI